MKKKIDNIIIALEVLISANINFYDTKSILECYREHIERSGLELIAEMDSWKNKWVIHSK